MYARPAKKVPFCVRMQCFVAESLGFTALNAYRWGSVEFFAVCENSVCSMLSATIAHIFQRRIVIFTQIYYTHRHHHTTSHHILNDMYMLRCVFFCVCMCMCVHIGTRVQSVSTDHQACVRRVQRSLRATLLRCCAVKKSDPRHTHSHREHSTHS